jgi:hypothetical protein
MLVESALLGLGGSVVGLLLALALLKALLSLDLPLPYGMRLDLHLGLNQNALFDWRVLTLTVGAGLVSGLLLGLFPALRGTRAELGRSLAAGTRGSSAAGLKWRNALVVAQISMSLLLLVGAGLFLRSWQQVLAVDPGFGRAPTSVLALMVPVSQAAPDSAPRMRSLLDRFRKEPGVEAVGLVWPLPLELSSSSTRFTVDGRALPQGQDAFPRPAGMGRRVVLRRRGDGRRRGPHVQRRRPPRQPAGRSHQPGDGAALLAGRRRRGARLAPAESW